MNKIKVECKNCKYFWAVRHRKRDSDKVLTDYYCDPHKSIKLDWLGQIDHYDSGELLYCSNENVNNDCPFYERKWWKFWVKRDHREELRKSLNKYMAENKIYNGMTLGLLDDKKIVEFLKLIGNKEYQSEIDCAWEEICNEFKENKKRIKENGI